MCTKKMLGGSAWRFTWSLSMALLAAGASHDLPASSKLTIHHADEVHGSSSGRLAVVVPIQQGDLSRAVGSLQRWPWTCSPVTQHSVDLVVYYAHMADEADGDAAVTQATQTIAETAGHCFSTTRVVHAHLDEEESYYSKGPSVQFYDMFVDEEVRPQLAEYDALAIIGWDVLVADDSSFEELYKAAFSAGDDFWVKGSRVGGTGFHMTSEVQDMWNGLGYINGNAIYNNNDPEFVEYVKYTLARWHYDYPYDMALWMTVSDVPYSWPIWQRYSGKFVSMNLISYLGTEHVDKSIMSDAVAGHTLFIQDSKAEDKTIGSINIASKQPSKGLPEAFVGHQPLHETVASEPLEWSCSSACGNQDTQGLAPLGTSTVCDKTCAIGAPYDDYLCGAGNPEKFGSMCRLCYTDVDEARKVELDLQVDSVDGNETKKHVIMCDTMQPPELDDCTDECARSEDAVCDSSCGNGRYGGYNCNWRNRGKHCRFCFDDHGAALLADEVAKRHGGRVIMCSTLEPPQATPIASLRGFKEPSLTLQGRRLSTTDSGTQDATSTDALSDTIDCLDGCEYTSFDGTRGRVCDATCQSGEPYGTYGCPARDGRYGEDCRVCYNDIDKATNQIDKGNAVIMCDTLAPPNVYRRLRVVNKYESASSVAHRLQSLKNTVMSKNGKEKERILDSRVDASSRSFSSDPEFDTLSLLGVYPSLDQDDLTEGAVRPNPDTTKVSPAPEVTTRTAGDGKDAAWDMAESASHPFFGDLAWSNLCAFIAGRAGDLDRLEVTVASILQFVPGMRVAVVAAENSLGAYESALGKYPGVKITGSSNPYAESLFADRHCGAGTEVIFYIEPGSIVSRSFTSKDTHSPRGDLLVAYGDARSSHRHTKLTRDAAALLGFKAPSFTFETDLFLPVKANEDLRNALSNDLRNDEAGADKDEVALQAVKTLELMDYFTIPQLLAAVQYSLNRGGLWFINPQEWAGKNMFKSVSIWDIPLLKPRFTCSLPPTVDQDSIDVAEVLHSRLEFFSRGGACKNGFISLEEAH